MKKNGKLKNPALSLRREHIRILTSAEMEKVAGGSPNEPDTVPPTVTCRCQSLVVAAACN